jgi:hypothetical protein
MGQAQAAGGASVIHLRTPTIIRKLSFRRELNEADRTLLAEIRAVFESFKAVDMSTRVLLGHLPIELTASELTERLSKLGIAATTVTVGAGSVAGYRAADFEKLWKRHDIKAAEPQPVINPAAQTSVPAIVKPATPRLVSQPKFDWLQFWAVSVAVLLAMVSAYFSVSGMTRIFQGAEAAVVIMTTTMEGGKLAGAAWLSRYWNSTSWSIRLILTGLLLILAVINAAGVYGQLSAAHLDPHVEAATSSDTRAVEAKARLAVQEGMLSDIKRRIELIDSSVQAAVTRGRAASAVDLANTQSKERASLVIQRMNVENELVPLRVEASRAAGAQQKAAADAGIMEYAAQFIGIDREKMIQFLILAMVLTCDPLSITLVMATAARKRARSPRPS